MTHIDKLTNEQLNHLAALAQDWECFPYEPDNPKSYWKRSEIGGLACIGLAKDYTPTTNAQQAFDLVKEFKLDVGTTNIDGEGWVSTEWTTPVEVEAPTPELAIVKAVVASKFGMEIDEGELG